MAAMLHLAHATPAAWTQAALACPERLLLDHKHCEGKAAAMARAFVKRYGKALPKLVPLMQALAAEEDEHAAICQRLLDERRAPRRPHHGNPYVSALRAAVHRARGGGVLDQLLIAATIEARSAERFRLLADALRGETMGRFYEDLFASEARHHALFVGLACDLFGDGPALARLGEVTAIEGAIVRARPWGPHLH